MAEITTEIKFIEFTITLDEDAHGACWSAEGSDGSEYFGKGHDVPTIRKEIEEMIPDSEYDTHVHGNAYHVKRWDSGEWEAENDMGDFFKGGELDDVDMRIAEQLAARAAE